MKRAGSLWPRLTSWENLLEAAHAAARGKRKRPDVALFLRDLEPNLCALQRELVQGHYRPGPYKAFWIRDPKPRQISAAPFRDRVVHHALTRVLEPIFEPRFTSKSFASRKGFGQHKALELARAACRRHTFVLKCDIRKYFPSLDHAILKELLGRAIKCRPTLNLAATIIDGSNPQEDSIAYYPGDGLFTPYERRHGIPIGNQTSQFFANVYLNSLDQFVLRELRPALYLRYVDDFVLFDNDRSRLRDMHSAIAGFLAELRLSLHERKSRIYRCSEGLTFLGWRFLPGTARLKRENIVRMRRRLRDMARRYHEGSVTFEQIRMRVHSWLGHASFGSTRRIRQSLFKRFILVPAEHSRNCSPGRLLEQ